jgi:hypothetical protein
MHLYIAQSYNDTYYDAIGRPSSNGFNISPHLMVHLILLL